MGKVKMIHSLFGFSMWVAEDRVEEYKAAGHMLAASTLKPIEKFEKPVSEELKEEEKTEKPVSEELKEAKEAKKTNKRK